MNKGVARRCNQTTEWSASDPGATKRGVRGRRRSLGSLRAGGGNHSVDIPRRVGGVGRGQRAGHLFGLGLGEPLQSSLAFSLWKEAEGALGFGRSWVDAVAAAVVAAARERRKEAFVPLAFGPGEAQVDWGEGPMVRLSTILSGIGSEP